MFVTDLVERIEKRRAKARAEFWNLVRRVAGGENVTPSEAEKILDAANETPRNLGDAAELMKKRLAWAALVAAQTERDAERERLREQAARHDAALEAAQQKHAAALRPLQNREAELRAIDGEARQAAHELEKSCPYVELLDAIKAAMRESGNALDRLNRARDAQREVAEYVDDADFEKSLRAEVGRRFPHSANYDVQVSLDRQSWEYAEQARARRAAAKREAADLPAATKARDAAEQRVRELRERLLIP